MFLSTSKAGESTVQVLNFNVHPAFDNDDGEDKPEVISS